MNQNVKTVLVFMNLFCLQNRGNTFGDDLRFQKAKQILHNGPSSPPR